VPEWGDVALLGLFAVHLAIFGRMTWRGRQLRHGIATITFLLLVAVFAVRLWSPEWSVAGVAVHRVLRWAAWGGTVVSLLLLVWPRLAAR